MTTTEQRLADALRDLYSLVPFDGNHEDETTKGPKLRAAREALADYDAQQATDPMAGVHAAHDKLSAALEDQDAANDDVRDAAIDLCDALNDLAAAGVRHA